MKNNRILLIASLSLMLWAPILSAKELVYKVVGQEMDWEQRTLIEETENGFQLTSTMSKDKMIQVKNQVMLNRDRATLSWIVNNKLEDIKVETVREENQLIVTGTKKDKRIDKKNDIDDRAWIQAIPFGIESFILSDQKKTAFWAINPVMFACATFDVEKLGDEIITIGDKEVETIHAKIALGGWLAIFWSAEYWFRKSDGLYVRFKGKLGPEMPEDTIVELITEID